MGQRFKHWPIFKEQIVEVLFPNDNVKKSDEKWWSLYRLYGNGHRNGYEMVLVMKYGIKIILPEKERKKAGVGKAGGWKEVAVMG